MNVIVIWYSELLHKGVLDVNLKLITHNCSSRAPPEKDDDHSSTQMWCLSWTLATDCTHNDIYLKMARYKVVNLPQQTMNLAKWKTHWVLHTMELAQKSVVYTQMYHRV